MYFQARFSCVISFTYDSKAKVIRKCPRTFWYGICICLVMTIFMANLIAMSVKNPRIWKGVFGANKTLLWAQAFVGIVYLAVMVYTFIYNVMFNDDFVNLVNIIVGLNEKYFQNNSEKSQKKMFYYCLLKYLVALYFNIVNYLAFFSYEGDILFLSLMTITFGSIVNIIQSVITLIFLSTLLNIKFYTVLKDQLEEILKEILSDDGDIVGLDWKINEISDIFEKVYSLHTYAF